MSEQSNLTSATTKAAACSDPTFGFTGPSGCTATGTTANPTPLEVRAADVAQRWLADLGRSAHAMGPTAAKAALTGLGVAFATTSPMLATLAASTVAMSGFVSPGNTPKAASNKDNSKSL